MKHKCLKMRVGVKYCGGCNPEYDRVALTSLIQERLEIKTNFVPWDSGEIDLALVVCGCQTACVDLSHFAGQRISMIKNPDDADFFLSEVKASETKDVLNKESCISCNPV